MCDCGKNVTEFSDVLVNDTIQCLACNKTCMYTLSNSQETLYTKITYISDIYGTLIVCVLGLFFNFLAILLFTHKKLPQSLFNNILFFLVIVDSIYLIIGLTDVCITLHPTYESVFVYLFILKPLRNSTMCCTCLLYTSPSPRDS